ncbi:hypothetical protein F7725_001140 [Dissostichus mawsoni]|uniref:Uncharacterized protein n=1 Tax=Dissostichus mawsoni TaxID=36200 RepID=A0A7J5ZGF5_DISMA|nr:hypothetical protein F7725_001140 [Dissostichus mawsoni]
MPSSCDGGKVLVYPVDGSHWLNMKILLEALHSKGHQITVIRSSTSWYVSEFSQHYTSITVIQEQSQNLESQDFMTSFLKRWSAVSTLSQASLGSQCALAFQWRGTLCHCSITSFLCPCIVL